MTISKACNAVLEYNPISLSLEGINFLQKKEHLEMKTLAVFFSVIPALLAYFVVKFADASLLPYLLTALSPLECGVLTLTVSFLALSVCFGIISKGFSQRSA